MTQTVQSACPLCGNLIQLDYEPNDFVSLEALVNMTICNVCYDQRKPRRAPGLPDPKQFKPSFQLTPEEEEYYNRRYPQ